MGSFTLAYRPKLGGSQDKSGKPARPTPGSDLHRALNNPKVTKPSPKAVKSIEDAEVEEAEQKSARVGLESPPTILPAPTANSHTKTADTTQTATSNETDDSTMSDDVIMTDAPTHETRETPNLAKLKPRAVRTSVHERNKRAGEVAKKLAEAEQERRLSFGEPERLAEKKKYHEEMCQEACSVIHSGADTADTTMTDAVGHDGSATGYDIDSGRWTDGKITSYNLKSYMPKAGMRYDDYGYEKGSRHLLGKLWQNDAVVLRALWSQQATRNKNGLQALITPIFEQAALKINIEGLSLMEAEESSFRGGDVPEDNYTYERPQERDILNMWKTFQVELRYQFSKETWPRKIGKAKFVNFFSVLADARLRECHHPKTDGCEHPELVRAITKFLQAANQVGIPWMMAYTEDEMDMDAREGEEAEGNH